MRFILLSKAR